MCLVPINAVFVPARALWAMKILTELWNQTSIWAHHDFSFAFVLCKCNSYVRRITTSGNVSNNSNPPFVSPDWFFRNATTMTCWLSWTSASAAIPSQSLFTLLHIMVSTQSDKPCTTTYLYWTHGIPCQCWILSSTYISEQQHVQLRLQSWAWFYEEGTKPNATGVLALMCHAKAPNRRHQTKIQAILPKRSRDIEVGHFHIYMFSQIKKKVLSLPFPENPKHQVV